MTILWPFDGYLLRYKTIHFNAYGRAIVRINYETKDVFGNYNNFCLTCQKVVEMWKCKCYHILG